ncbi:MAG: hypothetical protein AAF226_03855, partial [Verrucomicrobiota bacterium]
MAEKAHVTSVEAIDRFRSRLILFIERATVVLDEVSDEVKRTRIWLQTEQLTKLSQEMRRRAKELELLEAELMTARMSGLQNVKTGQQMRVTQKRREML